MNKPMWKLQQIGERLWILAAMMAQQAAALSKDGRSFAVVAEETRKAANSIQPLIEGALFESSDISREKITPIVLQLNLLALNSAIAACHLEEKGKQAAVCAEEIRILAYEIVTLFDGKIKEKTQQSAAPWPKTLLSTLNQKLGTHTFLSFRIAGIPVKENLLNVQEVVVGYAEHADGRIKLRGKELPVISCAKLLGTPLENPTYVIMRTPWAEQDIAYAVASDGSDGIFACPIGMPVNVPADMPLAKYVRECWENENGEPFYFMDWIKMA